MAVGIECAVPSINNIIGKIFSLNKITFLSRVTVSTHQLTHQPHLVVIHVLYAFHLSRAFRVASVNTIDAPLFCLRVRSKRIGAFVIVKIIKEPCHQALITLHVFSIKLWTVAF